MKILLIINPGIPVPPSLYGGIERVVFLLAEEYSRLGHEVTLIAGPESRCSGKTITFGVNKSHKTRVQSFKETLFVWKYLVLNHKQFDMIHNFGRLIYFFPILANPVLKVMSYQRAVTANGVRRITVLPNKNLIFTACSQDCVATGNVAGIWKTIYNAINFADYRLTEKIAHDAPLIFLGRLDQIKGAHTAVKVALETNNKLIIAGNIPDTADNLTYYKEILEPQFDGEQIKYVGPVNDAKKNELLGGAKALLFPIEWNEPFGIVMIEAMACGTPVIGFNRGSVPEVIDDKTGVRVDTIGEMIDAVRQIHRIDRRQCREAAASRFDITLIAKQYLHCFPDNNKAPAKTKVS